MSMKEARAYEILQLGQGYMVRPVHPDRSVYIGSGDNLAFTTLKEALDYLKATFTESEKKR